jgi:hypothetical protein
VQPAAREVEHVARPQHPVLDGLARLAQLRRVPLILQRQLERRLVHEPPLLTRDLEHEHVVRVVVNRQALSRSRRVVRVRLRRVAESLLERTTERANVGPSQVQPLEDDRRAALPLGEHSLDIGRARERRRAPGDVGRIVARPELLACLDETEARVA